MSGVEVVPSSHHFVVELDVGLDFGPDLNLDTDIVLADVNVLVWASVWISISALI